LHTPATGAGTPGAMWDRFGCEGRQERPGKAGSETGERRSEERRGRGRDDEKAGGKQNMGGADREVNKPAPRPRTTWSNASISTIGRILKFSIGNVTKRGD